MREVIRKAREICDCPDLSKGKKFVLIILILLSCIIGAISGWYFAGVYVSILILEPSGIFSVFIKTCERIPEIVVIKIICYIIFYGLIGFWIVRKIKSH